MCCSLWSTPKCLRAELIVTFIFYLVLPSYIREIPCINTIHTLLTRTSAFTHSFPDFLILSVCLISLYPTIFSYRLVCAADVAQCRLSGRGYRYGACTVGAPAADRLGHDATQPTFGGSASRHLAPTPLIWRSRQQRLALTPLIWRPRQQAPGPDPTHLAAPSTGSWPRPHSFGGPVNRHLALTPLIWRPRQQAPGTDPTHLAAPSTGTWSRPVAPVRPVTCHHRRHPDN